LASIARTDWNRLENTPNTAVGVRPDRGGLQNGFPGGKIRDPFLILPLVAAIFKFATGWNKESGGEPLKIFI
jgi:hypothetical protein